MKIFIIGRDPQTKPGEIPIRKDDPSLFMSKTHCKITLKDDKSMVIEDLGSKNGTFVNGCKINKPISLHLNDSILLANSLPINPVDVMNHPGFNKTNKADYPSGKPGAASGINVALVSKLILTTIVASLIGYFFYNYLFAPHKPYNGILDRLPNSDNFLYENWKTFENQYIEFRYPDYYQIQKSDDEMVILTNIGKTASFSVSVLICNSNTHADEKQTRESFSNSFNCDWVSKFKSNPESLLSFGFQENMYVEGQIEEVDGLQTWKRVRFGGATKTWGQLFGQDASTDPTKIKAWNAGTLIENHCLLAASGMSEENQWNKYSVDLDLILKSVKYIQ